MRSTRLLPQKWRQWFSRPEVVEFFESNDPEALRLRMTDTQLRGEEQKREVARMLRIAAGWGVHVRSVEDYVVRLRAKADDIDPDYQPTRPQRSRMSNIKGVKREDES